VWLLGQPTLLVGPQLGLRYAEDRDYPAWTADLDLSDEYLDQGFALAVAAGRDDVCDAVGDLPRVAAGGAVGIAATCSARSSRRARSCCDRALS
jgi:hypothetical protein